MDSWTRGHRISVKTKALNRYWLGTIKLQSQMSKLWSTGECQSLHVLAFHLALQSNCTPVDSKNRPRMKLLNTYEDKDEAEIALTKIQGQKRLASERDDTEVIYNLFGEPSWGNFYRLGMFSLPELQNIVSQKQNGQAYDEKKHIEIITMLQYVARNFDLKIPEHWLRT